MDIVRLKYFAAVAESGSMRKASELLHLTPSTLSRGIALLETDFGVPLFNRVGRGIELNADGRRLYALSGKIIHDLEQLRTNMRGGKAPQALLTIGSFEVFTTYCFGELVQSSLGSLNVRLLELTPGAIEQALLEERIDVGITYAPAPHPDLEFLKIGKFEMGAFARKDLLPKTETAKMPFAVPITTLQGNIVGFKSLDGWPDDQYPRQSPFQCELLESALELARQGKAAIHCPKFIVRLHNAMVRNEFCLNERPLPKGMRQVVMTCYIALRKGDVEDSAIKKLTHGLRQILR